MPQAIIEQVIFGGDGLIRESEGRVVFIPGALPQELVTYEISQSKRDYAKGKLITIDSPHPQRVQPLCPHYAVCEGCQLQHANYELQLELKRHWLQQQLERIAGIKIEIPPLVSCQAWGYRRSVEWTYFKGKLGYNSAHGALLPIKSCDLLANSKEAIATCLAIMNAVSLDQARLRWLQGYHPGDLPILGIEIEKGSRTKNKSSGLKEHLESSWKLYKTQFAGWIVHERKEVIRTLGNPWSDGTVLGLPIRWHGLGFVQNNIEGSLAFYQWIENHLRERRTAYPEEVELIDLFCGVGITSLLAARLGYQVQGFELNPVAIECAKFNAAKSQLEAKVDFAVRDLSLPIEAKEITKGAVWIANPPRTGLEESLITLLDDSKATCLFYLSCHPATLARDTKKMGSLGWQIKAIQAFDCFAQTTHFETALYLERT